MNKFIVIMWFFIIYFVSFSLIFKCKYVIWFVFFLDLFKILRRYFEKKYFYFSVVGCCNGNFILENKN